MENFCGRLMWTEYPLRNMVWFRCELCPYTCKKEIKVQRHVKDRHHVTHEEGKLYLNLAGNVGLVHSERSNSATSQEKWQYPPRNIDLVRSEPSGSTNRQEKVRCPPKNKGLVHSEPSGLTKRQIKVRYPPKNIRLVHSEPAASATVEGTKHIQLENDDLGSSYAARCKIPKKKADLVTEVGAPKTSKKENSTETEIPKKKKKRILRSSELIKAQSSPKGHPQFSCKFCSFKCSNQGRVQQHTIVQHTWSNKIKWFCCKFCPFKSPKPGRLQKHLVARHEAVENKEAIRCKLCPFRSKHPFQLREHLMQQHVANNKCGLCPFMTGRKGKLHRHLIGHHTDPEAADWFRCDHCELKFETNRRLQRHLIARHVPPPGGAFECQLCPFKTEEKGHLERHSMEQHVIMGDADWFHCEFCAFTSPKKRKLYRHVTEVHTTEELFQCELCPFKSTALVKILRHFAEQHFPPENASWFECDQCSFKSQHGKKLKRHLKGLPVAPKVGRSKQQKRSVWLRNIEIDGSLFAHTKNNVFWFCCQLCSFVSEELAELGKHLTTEHVIQKNFLWCKCHLCLYKCKSWAKFERHLMEENAKDSKSFLCRPFGWKKEEASERDVSPPADVAAAKDGRFYCHLCSYEGKKEARLVKHSRESHGDARDEIEEKKILDMAETAEAMHEVIEVYEEFQCEHCPFSAKDKKKETLLGHILTEHSTSDLWWSN